MIESDERKLQLPHIFSSLRSCPYLFLFPPSLTLSLALICLTFHNQIAKLQEKKIQSFKSDNPRLLGKLSCQQKYLYFSVEQSSSFPHQSPPKPLPHLHEQHVNQTTIDDDVVFRRFFLSFFFWIYVLKDLYIFSCILHPFSSVILTLTSSKHYIIIDKSIHSPTQINPSFVCSKKKY